MKINVVSRKLIKPRIPTPQNLRNYKISYLDDLNPPMNVGLLLFYPCKPERKSLLEESLAEILPQFYPLAGRYIKEDHLVDCNDQGAEFTETEAVDIELVDVVGKMTTIDQLNGLLPHQFYQLKEAATNPLLSIQITEFKRGGLVISISISHRIFDSESLRTFVAAWTNASINPGEKMSISPTFNGPTLFPWKDSVYCPHLEAYPNFVVKRFLFNKEAITSLRSKLNETGVSNSLAISRVRVVTALISKALIGVDQAKHGNSRACFISQAFNVRRRTVPPLPKHSCGNFAVACVTRRMDAAETKDIVIQQLIEAIGDATQKSIIDCAQILSPGADTHKFVDDIGANFVEIFKGGEVNPMFFSDWSKFGFYEIDFGWGKPVWATVGPMPLENVTILMDNKEGDGIEAWVHLNHKDMPVFEQDEDIRSFGTS